MGHDFSLLFLAIADDPAVRQLIVELKSEINAKKSNGDVLKSSNEDELSSWSQSRSRSRSRR